MKPMSKDLFCRFSISVQHSVHRIKISLKRQTTYAFVNFLLVMCEIQQLVGQSYFIFVFNHYYALHLHIYNTKKLQVILGN